MNKLVLFGAGKIGRSFIAQLFCRAGYETIFIDIDANLVDRINQEKKYRILIKDKQEEEIWVTNIRALHFSEREKITKELATARIAATSVGQKGLTALFPLIAEALIIRSKTESKPPLDIIIAENIRNADLLFHTELKKQLPADYPVRQMTGLIECSIGKMVPYMSAEDLAHDPLLVYAEAYNQLPVDAKAFKNPIPAVEGLLPKENMKAWVDRKSFIHNLGHAAAAYLGFVKMPHEKLLWKILADSEIYNKTRAAMMQSAQVLSLKYAGEFTINQLEDHVNELLARFQNKSLGDTVHRVGCDLYRKLGKDDRLAGAIHLAMEERLPFNHILDALYAGYQFKATDHEGKLHRNDEQFHTELERMGLPYMFRKISGLNFC